MHAVNSSFDICHVNNLKKVAVAESEKIESLTLSVAFTGDLVRSAHPLLQWIAAEAVAAGS